MLDIARRDRGIEAPTLDASSDADGDGAFSSADGSAITDALNARSYRKIRPVETTSRPTLEAMPDMLRLAARCAGHPLLPDIPERPDIFGGDGLRNVAFDLRLDRLAIRRDSDRVDLQPRDGFELYDLGHTASNERLYALKASRYASENIEDSGILHLFFLPSCRYAGGIAFPGRTPVTLTFYRSQRRAGGDGTDITLRKWEILRSQNYRSARPVLSDLIRIAGIDDRVFFLTAWPEKLSLRAVLPLDRGWTAEMDEALRGSYDAHGALKTDDIADRLRNAGLTIEPSDEEKPHYNIEIWEILDIGGEVRLARWWMPPPPLGSCCDTFLNFLPRSQD